jgi:ribonuclease P protein component
VKNKPDQKLPAAERIKQKKLFDLLFDQGKNLRLPPFRLIYREIPWDEKHPVRIAVIVPRRWMKHAVDRNRQKRLMRESYRLNKTGLVNLCSEQKKGLAIVFMIQCKTPLTYKETEDKIILLLQRLAGVYEKDFS